MTCSKRSSSALAVIVALAVAGCGQIDTDKAEKEIKEGIEKRTGAELKTVNCPDDVDAKKGDVFTCRATASDGSRLPIKVTQTDDDGSVKWETSR